MPSLRSLGASLLATLLLATLQVGCGIGLDALPQEKQPPGEVDSGGPTTLGTLEISASAVDFGTVAVGDTASVDLVLTSTDDVVTVEATLDDAGVFTVSATSLEVDGESILTLGFEPDDDSAFEGSLTLLAGADGEELVIPLTGTGESGDSGTNTDAGAIEATPTTWDFEGVDIGDVSLKSFTITNEGAEDLLVTLVEASHAVFTTGGTLRTPQVLTPGASETIDVTFAPDQESTWRGSVTVHSDDPNDAELVLTVSGEGIDRCDYCAPVIDVITGSDPNAITDFFSLSGSTDTRTITIQNVGDLDLDVSSVAVNNDLFAACGTFRVGGWGGAVSLAPWDTTDFELSYSTSGSCLDLPWPDLDANVVHILSNDPSNRDWIIELQGAGL